MGAYILRRLLLIIPTLFGIMVINFSLIQFVPGGPIEQVLARLDGGGDSVAGNFGGEADVAGADLGGDERYIGCTRPAAEFLADLEKQFGFARIICNPGYTGKPTIASPECRKEQIGLAERFWIMLWNYARFDFGESYFRSISVVDLVLEKMPVSISLGLWSTLIAYVMSIPLGIRKAVRDGTAFDTWTSGAIIVAYAIPSFLFAILLLVLFAGGSYWQWFPLRGLTSEDFDQLSLIGKALDYMWHMALPIFASTLASFATLTLLTKNSFLDEIGKQYVMTAGPRACRKGGCCMGMCSATRC